MIPDSISNLISMLGNSGLQPEDQLKANQMIIAMMSKQAAEIPTVTAEGSLDLTYDQVEEAAQKLREAQKEILPVQKVIGIHTDEQYDLIHHLITEHEDVFIPVYTYEQPVGSAEVGEIGVYNGVKLIDYRDVVGTRQAAFNATLLKEVTPGKEPLFIL